MSAEADVTPRAQPFYCPYCGEQDIRPDDRPGVTRCYLCGRLWRLEYLGIEDEG